MSKYTTQLRFICETEAGYSQSQGYVSINQIITRAAPRIFNFDFPIFDESYRLILEKKIIYHYYTREIGLETYGLWRLKLNAKMNEIMPYYNQLYEAQAKIVNPFWNKDITRDHILKNNSNSNTINKANLNTDETGTANNINKGKTKDTQSNTAWDKYSDTPQGSVQNLDNDTYLTNARKNTLTDNRTGSTTDETFNHNVSNTKSNSDSLGINTYENLDDYLEHVKGLEHSKTYGQLMKDFQESLLNIDMLIIDELSTLFMCIYDI